MYLLKRIDQGGGYVAPPGSQKSYTKNPLNARRYQTKEAAQADACGNEAPVEFAAMAALYPPTHY